MKKKLIKTILYLMGLGYVFIGVLFYDWSFRMVPFTSETSNIKIFFTGAIYIYFICLGISLYITTFFSIRKKIAGILIYKITFWVGIIALLIATIIITILYLNKKISKWYFGDIVTYIILLIPAIFVYLNKDKLIKNLEKT